MYLRGTETLRLPSPRKTCIMAVRTASSVGFDSSTSSQRTNDSSTFCERTSASAFKACQNNLATRLGENTLKRLL